MIKKLKPKSEFSRNVLTLMTGTTLAQAIPIAISPILTRLYTPEDFGVYALFLSVIMIFTPIATLRYEHAIMLPRSSKSALALFQGSFYILVFMSFLISILIAVFNNLIKLETVLLFLLPIAIFLTGLINIIIAYLNRRRNYKKISNSMIITSFTNGMLNLMIGLFTNSHLILSFNIFFSKALSLKYLYKNFIQNISIKISTKDIYGELRRYNDMLKYSTPSALISAINTQSIIIFLTYFFEPILAGGYFLIQRVFGTPISVFSSSFSKVFFKDFTRSSNKRDLMYKAWISLFLFTLPFAILLYFFMYDIIVFVFGNDWKFVAEIAQILLPLYIIRFIFSSTSSSHITLRIQHLSLAFAVISFFSKALIFIYGYHTNNAIGTIKLLVIYDILQILLMNVFAFIKTKDMN